MQLYSAVAKRDCVCGCIPDCGWAVCVYVCCYVNFNGWQTDSASGADRQTDEARHGRDARKTNNVLMAARHWQYPPPLLSKLSCLLALQLALPAAFKDFKIQGKLREQKLLPTYERCSRKAHD